MQHIRIKKGRRISPTSSHLSGFIVSYLRCFLMCRFLLHLIHTSNIILLNITRHKARKCRIYAIGQICLVLFILALAPKTWIYLFFFSLLRLTNAINSSMTPPHSHMIPNAIFSAQNQNGDITIHVIAKIKIPLLLMIFLLKLRFLFLFNYTPTSLKF